MKRCINCGREESEHCPGFESKNMPAGCKCDEGSLGQNVVPICGQFEPMTPLGHESYCRNCEHDSACHASHNAAPAPQSREEK